MAYADQADIVRHYGEGLLKIIADHDADGEPDAEVISARLDDATSLIDSYLASRYQTPVNPAPPFLRRYCVDIAVYSLPLSLDLLTEEMRRRYEDALKHLQLIAAGKASLGPGLGSDDEPAPLTAGAGIRFAERA